MRRPVTKHEQELAARPSPALVALPEERVAVGLGCVAQAAEGGRRVADGCPARAPGRAGHDVEAPIAAERKLDRNRVSGAETHCTWLADERRVETVERIVDGIGSGREGRVAGRVDGVDAE